MPRTVLVSASALALAVSLAGCAGEEDTDQPQGALTSTATAPAAPPTSAPTLAGPASPSPSPTPSAQLIDVQFINGEVTGVDQRVPVELGEQVLIRITSDIPEEVHVHGYDVYTDLVPGQTAEIAFTADLPGSYEVELHDAGRPLFQLRVS